MPSIKGTSSVTDNRALHKRMAAVKFPTNFAEKLDVDRVNRAVMTQWMENKITQLLGFEDEIVQSTAVNLFLPSRVEDGPKVEVNPKKAQIDLEGFLGEGPAAEFAAEAYTLLLDAQASGVGVPKKLVEEKKKELEAQKQQQQQHAAAARAPPRGPYGPRRDEPPHHNQQQRGPPPPRPRRSVSPERGGRDEFGRSARPRREDRYEPQRPPRDHPRPRRDYDRRPPSPPHYRSSSHRHDRHRRRDDYDRRPPPRGGDDRYGRYDREHDRGEHDNPADDHRRGRPRSRSRSPPSRRPRRRSRSVSSSSSTDSSVSYHSGDNRGSRRRR